MYRVTLTEFPGQPMIVKRYRPTFWFGLKEFFRPSRARRAYDIAERLRALGIPTALPVAAVDVRRLGWLRECYFAAVEVPKAEWLRGIRSRDQHPGYSRSLVRDFATIMARLHNAGFKHTDVTLSNFLVTHDEDNRPQLTVIDLDALRPRRRVSFGSAAEDLDTLVRRVPMSFREQLWFVAQYCQNRAGGIDAHCLARRLGILEATG